MLGEDEGRCWGDAPTSQGMPEITSKLPGARGGAEDRFSLTVLGETKSNLIDLELPACRTVRH